LLPYHCPLRSHSTSWRQLLIALLVLFVGIGLALFSDRIHRLLETTY
jgi:hypothetical protein